VDEIKVTITTLSPVILATQNDAAVMTATHDFFSGTTLRGILAGRYIKEQKLGRHGHRDEGFRQAFFGSLRFVHAYPVQQKQRSMVLPLSLQKDKAGASVLDMLIDERPEGKVYKSCKGLGIIDQARVFTVSVPKNISLHMSRSEEKERLSGKSEEGNIYNYEAIDAGQVFEGRIQGPASDLKAFMEALNLKDGKFDAYVGRSKYTQYGQCRIAFGVMEPMDLKAAANGTTVYLRLDTPIVPYAEIGDSAPAALQPIADMLNEKFPDESFFIQPDSIYGAATEIDNFVCIWNMRRPRQNAVAAGTVFALQKAQQPWTVEELRALTDICGNGVGDRVEEGFGQVRFWQHGQLCLGEEKPGQNQENRKQQELSKETKALVQKIIIRRVLERVRVQAYEDVAKLSNLKGKSHMFSRLESILSGYETIQNVRHKFNLEIKEEAKDGSVFNKHLDRVKVNGQTLYKIFTTDNSQMPYVNMRFTEYFPQGMDELCKEIGFDGTKDNADRLFYEYWKWFFRHGRKQAVQQGRRN